MTGNPIRVLMVDSETTWRGGEAQLLLLMRGLCEQGLDVALACDPESQIRERARGLPVAFFSIRMAGGMDLVAAWRLRGLLRRERFDVIHSHASHAHSTSFLACARLRSRPLQVVSRRVDFGIASNALSGIKYRHGADVYLAISEGVRSVLVEGGVPESRVRLVPSGIDLSKFDRVCDNAYLREEFAIAEGTRVVGNIAALAPHKSQADLIRAAGIVCARRDDVRFFIVGEGALEGELKALAARVGVADRVTFTGFREDVLELLSLFDCFVMSSYLEGLGTSIMDAHAAAIPVVATRTGGIVDVVEDGKTGVLVPPRDPPSLASAIVRMLDEEALRNDCVTRGLEQSRRYDYRHMVYKTLEAYRDLLVAVRPGPAPARGESTS